MRITEIHIHQKDLPVAGGPYDADAMIIPIIDFVVAAQPAARFEGLTLFPAYPNPAAGDTARGDVL